MNELQIFKNEKFGEVRVIEVNGEPYFVGRDVAIALGYSNPVAAISQHVDNEDSGNTLSLIVRVLRNKPPLSRKQGFIR